MYRDVEEMLTRELRGVADHVRVPALPELPTAPPPARFAWQPMLVAAALVLVALATVASLLRLGEGQTPQPAPEPTTVITDDATTAEPDPVPTGPPSVPHLLDGVLHVGGRTYPGYDYLQGGTDAGWLVGRPDLSWWWGNSGRPAPIPVPVEQSPGISPNGRYVAHLSPEGELSGFETAAGEGMGTPVQVPARDEDGVGTRTVVTDDGWVVASGRGVGVLWRPYVVDAEVVDLTETAPGQQVWQATRAGLVVFDASGDARTPGDGGRVYLADLTADGQLVPVADLPNFPGSMLDAAGEWVAWVPPGVAEGDVTEYDEIRVRRIDGGDEGVLTPPDGWRFVNRSFTFEDNQFLVVPVTDGKRERMVRCSPALQECVLLDVP